MAMWQLCSWIIQVCIKWMCDVTMKGLCHWAGNFVVYVTVLCLQGILSSSASFSFFRVFHLLVSSLCVISNDNNVLYYLYMYVCALLGMRVCVCVCGCVCGWVCGCMGKLLLGVSPHSVLSCVPDWANVYLTCMGPCAGWHLYNACNMYCPMAL